MPDDDDDESLSTEEAAQLLGCTARTVRNMIERGTIKATLKKIDPTVEKGVYRIPKSEIERIQKDSRP